MRSVEFPSVGSLFYAWLRQKVYSRLHCASEARFAVLVAVIWTAFYNFHFWELTVRAMWRPTPASALFFLSLAISLVSAQALLLLLMPTQRLLRLAASAMFIIAAASAYFISTYGAIMNQEMMRNVVETDAAEVVGLLNPELAAHLLLLGLLPALLVWRVALPARNWKQRLSERVIFIVAALALSAAGMFATSAHYAVFFREHKPLRYTVVPVAPTVSAIGLASNSSHNDKGPLIKAGGAVTRIGAATRRPLVIFLVVGETARAADFQLNGYRRPTNPELSKIDGLQYFTQTTSCGTATALSVPCMFSSLPREKFDVKEAQRYTNLLDVLVDAGFDVEWRDNNAGCKGVCDRVHEISYASRPDPALCPNGYCFDEVMLADLKSRLQSVQRDTVIVFHQIGSHGPAYAERYPSQFERFKPACHTNELHECSSQEVINAYDNSIAYTDHVLAEQIAALRAADQHVDSLLIYMSDHGESLGEQGVYLHGLPYRFAPRQQKEVPFVLWTSPGFVQRTQLDQACLRSRSQRPASHDNLYHTVMGAGDIRNAAYDPRLDVMSACRTHGRLANAD